MARQRHAETPAASTILSVDDNEANRYLRHRILAAAGFHVIEAANGTDALKLAAEKQPALVLLDIRLPDINGFAVCRRLKQDPRTSYIPVLHISQLGRREYDYPEALESGSDGYIREPVEPIDLLSTINALLRSRAAEKQAAAAERFAACVLETIPDAYIVFDNECRFRYVNPQFERLLGRSRECLIGRSIWNELPETVGTELERQCQRVVSDRVGTTFEYYFEPWHKWFEVRAYPCADGDGGFAACWSDITSRKRIELDLETEDHLLREIVQNAPVAISIVQAPEFVYELVNPAFQALAPGKQFLGQRFSEVWAEVSEPLVEILENVVATGRTFEIADAPYTIQRGPGCAPENVHITYSWIPLPGRDGEPDRVLTLATETTKAVRQRKALLSEIAERQRAQEESWRRQESFRALAENSPDNVDRLDREGRHIYVNEAVCRMMRLAPEAIIGKTNREIGVPDPWAGIWEARIRQVFETGQPLEIDDRFPTADGVRIFDTRCVPERAPDGTVTSVLAVSRDITQRIRGEEELLHARLEAERRAVEAEEGRRILNALMDYIPEGITIASAPDVVTVKCSRYGENLLTEGLGVEHYLSDGVTPARPEDLPLWRAVKFGETVEGKELVLRRSSGDLLPILCNAGPIRDRDGKITGGIVAWRDITALKRAEQALRHSERLYRAIGESIDYGVWICTPDGRNTYASESFLKLVGITQEQCSNFGWGSVLHPEERERTIAAWKECVRTGGNWDIEHRYLGVDGQYHAILARGVPVRDEQGRIVCWAGINLDISQRKRAEESLLEAHRRLNLLVNNSPLAVVEWDSEFHATRWAGDAQRVFGWTADEVLGRRVDEFPWIYEADRPAVNRVMADMRSGKQPSNITRNRNVRKDGTVLHCEWYNTATLDDAGRLVSVLSQVLDVTDRKQAEEALRREQSFLRNVIDFVPSIICVKDSEGRFVLANEATAKAANSTVAELAGRTQAEFFPEYAGKALEEEREILRSRKGLHNLERTIRSSDKQDHDYIVTKVPLTDEDGSCEKVLVVATDVTERKRIEERLRQAQKMESISLLAGGVAHDFNNLLVGVIGNASLALEMLPPDSATEPLLQRIVKSGDQAAHLTRQLLAYSGKGRFVLEPVDLSAVVEEVTDLVKSTTSKKITIQLELEPDLPAVEADRGQIYQVLMNLVINAAEAIGNNPGLISVQTGVHEIDERSIRELGPSEINPGKFVGIEVRDTGCGMDVATRARIFDPFFTTKFTGRGLGLAAVAGIVRGHKGAIRVRSAPGKGTSFLVLLPAMKTKRVRRAETAPRKGGANLRGFGTVLVIDDEEAIRDFARLALERGGCEVLVAGSGTEAIRILEQHWKRVSLVILDLSMPAMSGQETLPKLLAVKPDLAVVVSSGYAEADTLKLFEGMRVSGFIQKPYTIQQLTKTVRTAFKHAQKQ